MQDILQQIAEVLEDLLNCCNEMLKVSKEEGEAIKANDVQELFNICQVMTASAARLSQLEQERAALHSVAVKKLALPGNIGLRELLTVVRGLEAGGQLEDLLCHIENTADKLSWVYKELREQTEVNQMMVRQSVAYVNKLISILSPDSKLFYRRGGEMYRNRLCSPFVNQTV